MALVARLECGSHSSLNCQDPVSYTHLDGTRVWVVQLHRGISVSSGETIFPSANDEHVHYIEYDTNNGLEGLRSMIDAWQPGMGITLVGNVGITSHFGDVLRKARIPSKLVRVSV